MPLKSVCIIICVSIVVIDGFVPVSVGAVEKIVAGWLERVLVDENKLVFIAKLDTGAKHTSINAQNIVVFNRSGRPWVQFQLTDKNRQVLEMTCPVVRMASIKMHSGRHQDRPVVKLPICLGTIMKTVEVNIVDRSFFNYQVLIGRSFLQDAVIVDVSAKFRHRPRCRKAGF